MFAAGDLAVFCGLHGFHFQKVTIEIGEVLKPDTKADRRDFFIGGLEHAAGLSNAYSSDKFDKAVARNSQKIARKVGWAHLGHIGCGIDRKLIGKIIHNVIHHLADARLFAAAVGMHQLQHRKGFLVAMGGHCGQQFQKYQNLVRTRAVSDFGQTGLGVFCVKVDKLNA